ncbi:MAG TPA: hypothetical protein VFJ57_01325 [Solirubrobacterales bacterium]|nr:hypothetical protein [Solirubrobacterales bacterium]
MARLVTTGFESRQYAPENPQFAEGQGVFQGGTAATADQANNFDGGSCAKCAKTKSSIVGIENNATNVNSTLGRAYYLRAAVKFSSNAPTANLTFVKIFAASNIELVLTTGKQVDLWNNLKLSNALEGVLKPEANRYYLFEMKVLVAASGNGTLALRIYSDTGATLYDSGDKSVEIGNTKVTFWEVGRFGTEETNVDVYVSHLALNDSTGEKQNSWAGFAKVALQKPISDKARTGWVAGGSPTEEKLWEALDNVPPEGKAVGSSTHTSQIKDANNNATDTYQANLQTYAEAGVGSSDAVNLVMAIFRVGNNSTTSRSVALKGISNPEITEVTQATPTTVAGTDPTGWATGVTAPVYGPSVTRTESPVLQVRKATATTNTVSADLLGLYTEYVPATSTSIRRFNGVSDEVVLGIGANAAAYGTMAVLFRPAAEHFGAPFSTNGASNYARRVGIFNRSPAFSSFDVDVELGGVENQIAPGEWALLVVTKATGTVKPRFHLWKGGSWNHVDAGGTLADYAGETQTNVRLGRFLTYNDWFRGDIAAAAHWASKALSDAECEALVAVGSLEGWAGKSPSGLWLFNQVSLSDEVKDKTANAANQTSRSGTTVVAEAPPIPYVASAIPGMVV